jgi:carboxyl-terminal processing protease
MMRALPQVTHLGQPTSGAFSQILEKELPNGWTIGLSNYIAADHNGNVWEGRGVRPEISVPVVSKAGVFSRHIRAVERVRRIALERVN